MKKNIFALTFLLLGLATLHTETIIGKISFVNQSAYSDKQLKEIIRLEEDEPFELRYIKLDKILLSNFFRKQGYLTVSVDDSLSYSSDRSSVDIFYTVESGPRYYYAGARITGVKELDRTKIDEIINEYKSGSPFDESIINTVRKKIENLYYNFGKPFVQIKLNYDFEQDTLVYANFKIKENQTIYIRNINYNGLKLVQKFIVRREMELRPGSRYSRKKLDLSQQNLYGTGLFRYVRFEISPVSGDSSKADLNILMQEKEARWVGFYIGVAHEQDLSYGSKLELTLEGGHRNLFGTARAISLQITPSFLYESSTHKILNSENRIAFKFVEPWIGFTRTPGTFQISYRRSRLPSIADFNLLLASFGLHHKFPENYDINATISAKLLENLSNKEIDPSLLQGFPQGQNKIYALSFYGKRDTRKNLFTPRDGALTDLSISISKSIGELTDGTPDNNSFVTLISSWQRYQPFSYKLFGHQFDITLATRVKLGGIVELGQAKNIPVTELFYAGGANTVRGYQEQLLGPAAAVDSVSGHITLAAGGKLLYLNNVEMRIPLFWLLVGEVFVDAGNVWRETGDFRLSDIRVSTGLGLALITPLGPIRLDYGYKLLRRPIDPGPDAFHLGIYFAF